MSLECDTEDETLYPWYRMEKRYQGNSTDTREDWVFAFIANIKDTFEGQIYEMNVWGTNEFGQASEPLIFMGYLPPPTKVNNFDTVPVTANFNEQTQRVDGYWFVDSYPPQRFERLWEKEDVRTVAGLS